MDYVIATPNSNKSKRVCHVNLMKAHKARDVSVLCSYLETDNADCVEEIASPELNFDDSLKILNNENYVSIIKNGNYLKTVYGNCNVDVLSDVNLHVVSNEVKIACRMNCVILKMTINYLK